MNIVWRGPRRVGGVAAGSGRGGEVRSGHHVSPTTSYLFKTSDDGLPPWSLVHTSEAVRAGGPAGTYSRICACLPRSRAPKVVAFLRRRVQIVVGYILYSGRNETHAYIRLCIEASTLRCCFRNGWDAKTIVIAITLTAPMVW